MDDEGAEPGRIPRTVEVELRGDLVDTCVPGDVVTVAGVIKTISTEALSGRRAARDGKHQSLYLLYIQANSMHNKRQAERQADEEMEQMEAMMDSAALAAAAATAAGSEEGGGEEFAKIEGHFHLKHLGAIRAIASDPHCFHLLVASLCPPIVGHELVKAGLLLTLLGGTKRTDPSSARTRVRVRSDPHILLVGDPGLGKSQMLRACHDAAPRAVYLCGTMATSTGLTVTLVNDGRGDVALEAGALVLSDQGVCCIDELDKLSCSYHALLEAMEQQQISIAKSGVVTSLSARCSIIAAANPVGGQYQRGKTVSENLKMSGALFSRFDLVFIMLDRADDEHDARVSHQIVRMHAQQKGGAGGGGSPFLFGGGGGGGGRVTEKDLRDRESRSLSQRLRLGVDLVKGDPVPKELLRKYLAYARKVRHPSLPPSFPPFLFRDTHSPVPPSLPPSFPSFSTSTPASPLPPPRS
jgi:DNA helicase MCM8